MYFKISGSFCIVQMNLLVVFNPLTDVTPPEFWFKLRSIKDTCSNDQLKLGLLSDFMCGLNIIRFLHIPQPALREFSPS